MELDEHEQGELVQKWLRQNGSSLITGIAMGLALVFAWQWWQGKGARHQEEAATQYQAYVDALEAKDAGKAKAFSDLLARTYGDTAYSQLAVLRNVAALQDQGKTADAIKQLQAAKSSFARADFSELASLRLARLELIAGKPADARKQVDSIANPLFPAIADELRGDIAIAEGNREQARKSYAKALTTLDQAAPTRSLLELKLIDAGGKSPAKPEI